MVKADIKQPFSERVRVLLIIGTVVYTLLVLYLMFLGFNRIERQESYNQLTFMMIPEGVPLKFPRLSMGWVYDLGNIGAFIPFGIAIPLIFGMRFRTFIGAFIASIFFLEVIQSLTFLGTFDTMDIISNTLGAIIGFLVYKIAFFPKLTIRRSIQGLLVIPLCIVVIMVVSEAIDYGIYVNEYIGPVQGLIEEKVTEEEASEELIAMPFTIDGERIEPTFDSYTSIDGSRTEYIFTVNKRNVWFYAKGGFPDDAAHEGGVEILINGQEYASLSSAEAELGIWQMKTYIEDEIGEVKIIVSGNAVVWDVSYSKMKHWWE